MGSIKASVSRSHGRISKDGRFGVKNGLERQSGFLKRRGIFCCYGIHNYLCYNQVSLYKLGLKYRRQFIWHYENGFCGNKRLPRATYEPLLWFSKTDDFYFGEMREPYKSEERLRYKIIKNGKVWQPNPDGRIAGDVWVIPTLAGRRFRDEKVNHPTQKPLALSERLVRHFSPKGGLIVVPFAGSGSECVAAFRNNRTFLATDINSYGFPLSPKHGLNRRVGIKHPRWKTDHLVKGLRSSLPDQRLANDRHLTMPNKLSCLA